jgi:hypothetical protein
MEKPIWTALFNQAMRYAVADTPSSQSHLWRVPYCLPYV